jgi:4-hydroxy-tetrahydrodipicolinate synthase
MKEALVLLGVSSKAFVRPPLVKLRADEIEHIRVALIAGKVLQPRGAPVATGA